MSETLEFRSASEADLPALVELLRDDEFGRQRNPTFEMGRARYLAAMAAIEADPNSDILVADEGGRLAGMLQLTFIPGLGFGGGERLQIENVRVASGARGQGIGRRLVDFAISLARARGCYLVHLTSDVRRIEARRFYEEIGFQPTHIGFKLKL